MNVALMVADILIIVAFVALIVTCGVLAVVVLRMKNDVMRNSKRIYERPVRSVKNVVTAGKGIYMQESVRVQHAASTIRKTAGVVKTTVDDTREAVEVLREADWEPILAMAQAGMQFATAAAKVAGAARKQGAEG